MTNHRWSADQAWTWMYEHPWICGFNFLPSTAVNSTEMWQAESFDPITIDRELGWAKETGLNSCRVFVQYLVWKDNPNSQKKRMDHFLRLADKHDISTMFILFDDCAFSGKQPYLGAQDAPVPGVHNSGWTPSPGFERVSDRSYWPDLEAYVQDLMTHFANDTRVIAWDLYNEPGNSDMKEKSQPLLAATYDWSRSVRPSQPLTTGLWSQAVPDLEQVSLEQSDVISFHAYGDLEFTLKPIEQLEAHGRPLLCTEWLFRPRNSLFETHLPLFRERKVGWYIWGLVNGKTQTHCSWGSPPGSPEPKVWQHDILRRDGSPYCKDEIEFVCQYLSDKVVPRT